MFYILGDHCCEAGFIQLSGEYLEFVLTLKFNESRINVKNKIEKLILRERLKHMRKSCGHCRILFSFFSFFYHMQFRL